MTKKQHIFHKHHCKWWWYWCWHGFKQICHLKKINVINGTQDYPSELTSITGGTQYEPSTLTSGTGDSKKSSNVKPDK